MFCLCSFAILAFVAYRLYQHFFPPPNISSRGKYVLISGCDSGFGHGLAIELDRQGFNVLAGVFLADTIPTLTSELSGQATVFQLDITDQSSIDAAYELVKSKTKVLHGLVNNAGIGTSGNVDWTSLELMRRVMDVNFFGHVAMTKKFLPLLIAKTDSRVVNICSVAGYLAAAGMSAYCASKYALESFSDCLRREMYPWKLRVCIIEPGFMRTPIIEGRPKDFESVWSKFPADVQQRWGEDFLRSQFNASATSALLKYAEDPMKVVKVLAHAISSSTPRIRYRPGVQSSCLFFPISMLPAWIADWLLRNISPLKTMPASVANQVQQ